MRLALAQYRIGRPESMDAFAAALDARVVEAARAGAELLVLPEYACVEVAAAFIGGPDLADEIEAVRSRVDTLVGVCRDMARRHGVWLLAGSLPVGAADPYTPQSGDAPKSSPSPSWGGPGWGETAHADSRGLPPRGTSPPDVSGVLESMSVSSRADLSAHPNPPHKGEGVFGASSKALFIAPDGLVGWQDKHVPTPFEAEQWGLTAGSAPGVLETPWGRVGICVCYDVEFPSLVRAQVRAGAWLILVPACTDTMAGFNRVRLAARARAIENQCFVAIAPTVGAAPWLASLDVNRGYAAVFGPCDHGFPDDGVLARGVLDEPGWVYADLDPVLLDAVRATGAVRNHRDWPDEPPPCPVIPLR